MRRGLDCHGPGAISPRAKRVNDRRAPSSRAGPRSSRGRPFSRPVLLTAPDLLEAGRNVVARVAGAAFLLRLHFRAARGRLRPADSAGPTDPAPRRTTAWRASRGSSPSRFRHRSRRSWPSFRGAGYRPCGSGSPRSRRCTRSFHSGSGGAHRHRLLPQVTSAGAGAASASDTATARRCASGETGRFNALRPVRQTLVQTGQACGADYGHGRARKARPENPVRFRHSASRATSPRFVPRAGSPSAPSRRAGRRHDSASERVAVRSDRASRAR